MALAMHKHRKTTANMSGLANNPRKFVALRMNKLPPRPADVLTTYAVQGGKSGFKPTARPDSEVEIARLVELHRNTKRAFDLECLAPSSRATKAREGGGGSVSAPEFGCGAASSAKRGGYGKASGRRIEVKDSGDVDTAILAPAGTPPRSALGERPTKRPPVFGLSTAPSGDGQVIRLQVCGSTSHHFNCNMRALSVRYRLQPFLGVFHPCGPSPTWTVPGDLTVTVHLAGFWGDSRLVGNWYLVMLWLEGIGERVVTHHFGRSQPRQIGVSCGIVAARVLTWARQDWSNLEKIGTSVGPAVLQHANTALAAAGQTKAHFSGTTHFKFLNESAVISLGQHYMQAEVGDCPPPLPLNDPIMTWPFQCVTFDCLLIEIAKKLVEAASTDSAGKFFFCGNSEGTSSSGLHWVAFIWDIGANSPAAGTAAETTGLA